MAGRLGPHPVAPTTAHPVHSARVSLASLTSTPAGVVAGRTYRLHGTVVNERAHAVRRAVIARLLRAGGRSVVIGHGVATARAHDNSTYDVTVRIPRGLADGTYPIVACVHRDRRSDALSCASARRVVTIGGTAAAHSSGASRAARRDVCSSGARTLSKPGERVYPEIGNGGYTSVHTDVYIVYDALTNLFLPGTHVDLQQRATQCLTDFSLDFERTNVRHQRRPART